MELNLREEVYTAELKEMPKCKKYTVKIEITNNRMNDTRICNYSLFPGQTNLIIQHYIFKTVICYTKLLVNGDHD